jgi:hypothetical protein
VQVPQGSSDDNLVTIGKATLDLAKYVEETGSTQNAVVPITYKVGSSSSSGNIKLVITTTLLGDMSEDGMTEVSGMTGLTSEGGTGADQDLDGEAPPYRCVAYSRWPL